MHTKTNTHIDIESSVPSVQSVQSESKFTKCIDIFKKVRKSSKTCDDERAIQIDKSMTHDISESDTLCIKAIQQHSEKANIECPHLVMADKYIDNKEENCELEPCDKNETPDELEKVEKKGTRKGKGTKEEKEKGTKEVKEKGTKEVKEKGIKEEKSDEKEKDPHSCYILFNNKHCSTYNGYTNNLKRRIRQHNGYIKGGAIFTTKKKKQHPDFMWQFLAIIFSPQFTKISALRVEWQIKHPTGARVRPKSMNHPAGRLRGLSMALTSPKFEDHTFVVYVHEAYKDVMMPKHPRIQYRIGSHEEYLQSVEKEKV